VLHGAESGVFFSTAFAVVLHNNCTRGKGTALLCSRPTTDLFTVVMVTYDMKRWPFNDWTSKKEPMSLQMDLYYLFIFLKKLSYLTVLYGFFKGVVFFLMVMVIAAIHFFGFD